MGAGKARLFNCSLAPLLGAVGRWGALAEGVGFEPTVRTRRTTVFKTVPINHSGTPPRYKIARRATAATERGQRSMEPVNLLEYEPLARQKLPEGSYGFIAGAAEDEGTLRENRAALPRPGA